MPTTKLGLPLITGNMTNDVVRDHNALAEAVDAKVGVANGIATLGSDGKVPAEQLNVSAPSDASTTVKGIVMLEDSTSSTSVTKAATPKSVKDVKDTIPLLNNTLTSTSVNQAATANTVKTVNDNLVTHQADIVKHITSTERTTWNGKQNALTANQTRTIYVQTIAPTSPQEGDIWIEV